jgi:transcriptional regulator with XRE-family HTH domain
MGYKIRECREEIGISQEELAKRAKISRTTLSGLESGTVKTTTTNTLLKIATALNKSVADIFF